MGTFGHGSDVGFEQDLVLIAWRLEDLDSSGSQLAPGCARIGVISAGLVCRLEEGEQAAPQRGSTDRDTCH